MSDAKKPTLESCDYDSGKYEAQVDAWYGERDARRDAIRREETEKKRWDERVSHYHSGRDKMGVADFADAEKAVSGCLSQEQQGIIIAGSVAPAETIYYLGKNPERAKEISGMKDPVQFAVAVGRLDFERASSGAPATRPEQVVRGGQGMSGVVDGTLEGLRNAAAKDGDYTPVIAYRTANLRRV